MGPRVAEYWPRRLALITLLAAAGGAVLAGCGGHKHRAGESNGRGSINVASTLRSDVAGTPGRAETDRAT